MIILGVLAIFVILIIISAWKHWESLKDPTIIKNFPDLPLIRHTLIFFGDNEDRMNLFKKLANFAYSNKHGVATAYVGPLPIMFISDAEKAVTVLKTTNCKGHAAKLGRRLVGNGLIFAPARVWHRRRKILFPSFSSKHLTQFVYVFESQTKIAVKKLEPHVGKGNFSLRSYLELNALDSICETAFGINLKIQHRPDHPLVDDLSKYLKNASALFCRPLLNIDVIYNILPISREQQQFKDNILKFIDDVIYKKKALMSGELKTVDKLNGAEASCITMECFLEAMIKHSNEEGQEYTVEELRNEVLTLAIAGSDTSVTTTGFVFVLLSHHPDIQERAYQEVLEMLDADKPLEIADVQKLKYIEAIIKETLRLYPSAPMLNRYTNREIKFDSGISLKKNQTAVINVWGLHHNPHYWGPDVEDFNPDRFIANPQPVPGTFIPFSIGPRNCIGYQYAMLSMKAGVATMLRNYRFKPATSFTYGKGNPLRVTFDIMLRHVHDFEVQIERRGS